MSVEIADATLAGPGFQTYEAASAWLTTLNEGDEVQLAQEAVIFVHDGTSWNEYIVPSGSRVQLTSNVSMATVQHVGHEFLPMIIADIEYDG